MREGDTSETGKMRTGAPKQKWTPEEECALRAGVEKYGPGKWRAIQRDPKFGPALVARSNVDLKDKWRNLSVSAGNHGPRIPRSKTRKTSKGSGSSKNFSGSSDSEDADADDYEDDDGSETPVSNQRKQLGPRYDELVSEAIVALKEPNGSDITAIANYIEEHQKVPSRFRKLLTLKLKALTAQEKLVKVGKSYKVRDYWACQKTSKGQRGRKQDVDERGSPKFLRSPTSFDLSYARFKMKSAEDAARAAAQAVADAEAAAAAAEQAAKEFEIAEAEAEALEAVAEAAAAAIAQRPKSMVEAPPASFLC